MSAYMTLLQCLVIVDYSVIRTLTLVCRCFRARTYLIVYHSTQDSEVIK